MSTIDVLFGKGSAPKKCGWSEQDVLEALKLGLEHDPIFNDDKAVDGLECTCGTQLKMVKGTKKVSKDWRNVRFKCICPKCGKKYRYEQDDDMGELDLIDG